MRDLPGLGLFDVFEAAARHLSFTRAAGELNVQQPAVSRQIAALEEQLGAPLFLRSKPVLTLTPEGKALYASVSAGLTDLRRVVQEIRGQRRARVLVVNAAIGFASYFLIPRLAEFQTQHPEIELELVTRDQNLGFDPRACDVLFIFGKAGWPGSESRPVLREELCAISAPGYLPEKRMLTAAGLVQQRLLHLTSDEHADDWALFLEGTGVSAPPPNRLDRFYSFMVYLHAVQNGNGIALGWSQITDSLIESGRLRLASDRRIKTDRGYHCCILEQSQDKAEAKAFLEWVAGISTQ